jgi:hypothetical protein
VEIGLFPLTKVSESRKVNGGGVVFTRMNTGVHKLSSVWTDAGKRPKEFRCIDVPNVRFMRGLGVDERLPTGGITEWQQV